MTLDTVSIQPPKGERTPMTDSGGNLPTRGRRTEVKVPELSPRTRPESPPVETIDRCVSVDTFDGDLGRRVRKGCNPGSVPKRPRRPSRVHNGKESWWEGRPPFRPHTIDTLGYVPWRTRPETKGDSIPSARDRREDRGSGRLEGDCSPNQVRKLCPVY